MKALARGVIYGLAGSALVAVLWVGLEIAVIFEPYLRP